MIEKLAIKNFKSIKELDIDCRRINLFIGEPNTGKSNILEALGLLSWRGNLSEDLREFVRFEETQDLFYDGSLNEKIEIRIDYPPKVTFSTEIGFFSDTFQIINKSNSWAEHKSKEGFYSITLDYSGDNSNKNKTMYKLDELLFLKYYKFLKQNNFPGKFSSSLLPPHGSNLFALAMGNKEISERMSGFFEYLDLKIMLKSRERAFSIVKQIDNKLISYPYNSTSDTLQRIIFYTIAMESNQNSTLIFEEPESFAFPYYTKYLGERIAFDETNQYFISTHNPYLLFAILEKTSKDAVNVFITYLKGYETKVKALTDEEIPVLMDADPFFNLGYFLEEE
jgi:AAA15 family ATPase/GTPase